jgi:DNA-binding response OmpR family regulator
LKQGLEEEGYEVSTATDGQSGFEMVQNTVFDIILLDWMSPKDEWNRTMQSHKN